MEHLQSPELAAKYLGKEAEYEQVVSVLNHLPESVKASQLALYKLSILSEAAWKIAGKTLNWTIIGQRKYYPLFDIWSGSASGFSYNDNDYDYSKSGVSSRLVFPTIQTEQYVGETHMELYRDLFIISN